jgi:hypothetical protein
MVDYGTDVGMGVHPAMDFYMYTQSRAYEFGTFPFKLLCKFVNAVNTGALLPSNRPSALHASPDVLSAIIHWTFSRARFKRGRFVAASRTLLT